jgi:lipid-A-disaccharide synthase
MARFIDHVLALLPFEPPLMEAAGMACDFVGHPVVADPQATPAEVAAFRAEVAADGPLVLALPGSRAGEVTRLADRFGAALALMAKDHPGLRVVLPAAAHVVDLVRDRTRDWPVRPLILDPAEDRGGARKRAAFAAADVALAASGTVSLELAAAGTPMVIAYDVSWLTRQIARRMVKLDTFTLVNLVSETRTIPEFIAENCQPGPIAKALSAVLTESAPQQAAMARTMALLGKGGEAPGLRAARAILARA